MHEGMALTGMHFLISPEGNSVPLRLISPTYCMPEIVTSKLPSPSTQLNRL